MEKADGEKAAKCGAASGEENKAKEAVKTGEDVEEAVKQQKDLLAGREK